METIRDLIDWLNERDIYRIDVFDPKKDKELYKRISAKKIEEDLGGVDQFLADLAAKTDSISVLRTRKYGGSYHRVGAPVMFRFNNNSSNVGGGESGNPVAPAPTKTQSEIPMSNTTQGLAGFAGLNAPGLGAYIEATNKAALLGEITRQKEKFETRSEFLEKENQRLKDEINDLKRDSDNQPDALTNLLTKVVETGQAAEIMQVFMTKNAKPASGMEALNAPELSATKRELINYIQNPQVTDRLAQEAFRIIIYGMEGKQAFIDEYQELIKKHAQNG